MKKFAKHLLVKNVTLHQVRCLVQLLPERNYGIQIHCLLLLQKIVLPNLLVFGSILAVFLQLLLGLLFLLGFLPHHKTVFHHSKLMNLEKVHQKRSKHKHKLKHILPGPILFLLQSHNYLHEEEIETMQIVRLLLLSHFRESWRKKGERQ